MRILFISLGGIFPFSIGGPSVVAYNLVKNFNQKDLNVDLIFGVSKQDLSKITDMDKVLQLPKNVSLYPIIKNERLLTSYNTVIGINFLKDAFEITRKLSETDVVHFQYIPNTRDLLVPFLALFQKIPTVFRVAGWLTYEALYKSEGSLYYDFFTYRLLHKMFTKIVCNSLFTKQKTMEDGIDEQRIEIIPNGVNIREFRNANQVDLRGDPVLLFVGRLEYSKGIDVLIQSMQTVVKELPSAILHVVGNGSLMNQLTNYVLSHHMRKNVVFHGRITANLPSFYKSADICVFPSLFETFGITTIEAMAAGKPLIATKRGGVPEHIVHLRNGILINPTIPNLSRSIIKLWRDKNLMKNMSRENLEKSTKYDWSNISKQYISLYTRLVKMKR